VNRLIFVVLLLLFFILLSLRASTPAYSNLPPVFKSLIQLKLAPVIVLPDFKLSQTESVSGGAQDKSSAVTDHSY
jgi:hypothetical protein